MFADDRRLHRQLLRTVDTDMTLARRDAIVGAFSKQRDFGLRE
jgi:hypothetical protein